LKHSCIRCTKALASSRAVIGVIPSWLVDRVMMSGARQVTGAPPRLCSE
jgi:hypothetical protein